jgi:hypothetical protein
MYDAQNAVSDRGKSRPINPLAPAGALDAAVAGVLAAAEDVVAAGAEDAEDAVAAGAEDVAVLALLDLLELHAAANRTDAMTTAPI